MPSSNKSYQLINDIELFIQYAVPETERERAVELVNRYNKNAFVMRLFFEFYSRLPEAREEAVVKISGLMNKQGIHLFVVSTVNYSYLYMVSIDQILYLGEYLQEVDSELLSFFGFASQQAFKKKCPLVKELKEYPYSLGKEKEICPVCGVTDGDCHLLGCTVEICPWCAGQLSNCNCRFQQLETDDISDEEQLEKFIDLLTAKGRLPYLKNQAPAYPGTSGGLDDGQTSTEV